MRSWAAPKRWGGWWAACAPPRRGGVRSPDSGHSSLTTHHSSLVVLLTDFGLEDAYVGTMKGVILGINPSATIVDLCHQVPPRDVVAGAFLLAGSYRYFPPEAIFVAVVDPGVGSERRAIA